MCIRDRLGVVGPMARTVRDLERLFEVMAGPDPGDPASAPVPLRRWSEQEIRKLGVAYFVDDGVTPVTSETAAAVRTAVEALRTQGFNVAEWRPRNLDRVWQLWWNPVSYTHLDVYKRQRHIFKLRRSITSGTKRALL